MIFVLYPKEKLGVKKYCIGVTIGADIKMLNKK